MKNVSIGVLGGPLVDPLNVDLLECGQNRAINTTRINLMNVMDDESRIQKSDHLALVVDSTGGALFQYLNWQGIMVNPNIQDTTAYIANHAASVAAMIVGAAKHIVCLPTTKFYYHFSSGVNTTQQGEAKDPFQIMSGFRFAIDSLIQFGRNHLNDEGRKWLEEKILTSFYVDPERGSADIKRIDSMGVDMIEIMMTETDSTLYKPEGELTFTGQELADRGDVELVSSVAELQKRFVQDMELSDVHADPRLSKVDDLFKIASLVEYMRASGKECFVDLFRDTFIFRTMDTNS